MRWGSFALIAICAVGMVASAILPAQTRARSQPRAVEREIRIGVGHGIAFLPLYIAQEQKLLEKHAKAAGLASRIVVQRFNTAEPLHRAMAKGEIAAGAFGLATVLLTRDTSNTLVALSGLTTLPLSLLTARNLKSLADLRAGDRIAVPTSSGPQVTYLRVHADKTFFGAWNRLRPQVMVTAHQDAVDALTQGKSNVAAYFASPPFTQMAKKDPKVRVMLTSEDIMGGKTSFLVMAASAEALSAQPKLAEVLSKAIDEASRIIRTDSRRAAATWLKFEPSSTLDVNAVDGILRELKDDFGSGVYGVEAAAALMSRDGRLKNMPASWKDIVAPILAAGSGS